MASFGQRLLSAAVPKKMWDTDSELLQALREGSETLQNITDQFVPLMKRFHICFFWEQEKTDLPHTRDYVSSFLHLRLEEILSDVARLSTNPQRLLLLMGQRDVV